MPTLSITISLTGLFFALFFSAVFYVLQTATLSLNRIRLLKLFSDSDSAMGSEQKILNETKDNYFISRLGLCAMYTIAMILSLYLLQQATATLLDLDLMSPLCFVLSLMLTLVFLPPVYMFLVFALPRLMTKSAVDSAQTRFPSWLGHFLSAVQPLAILRHLPDALHLGKFLPRRELTKSDLLALVTDLEEDANGDMDDPDEEEFIYNILDLEQTWVREVMRPINEVVAIRLDERVNMGLLRRLSLATGYSRFPVYRNRIVNLVGYVSVYDLLYGETSSGDLTSIVLEPFYVPEFMLASDLLREFRKRREHVAIVVDEHGGSSGWITREDLLEEIVGEIQDEFDALQRMIVSCSPGQWLVDGKTDIDDLVAELPLHFHEPVYDTLAGFMLLTLGAIPKVGDQVQTSQATFLVEEMDHNRIAKVRIQLVKK